MEKAKHTIAGWRVFTPSDYREPHGRNTGLGRTIWKGYTKKRTCRQDLYRNVSCHGTHGQEAVESSEGLYALWELFKVHLWNWMCWPSLENWILNRHAAHWVSLRTCAIQRLVRFGVAKYALVQNWLPNTFKRHEYSYRTRRTSFIPPRWSNWNGRETYVCHSR